MLTSFKVKSFKSLENVEVELGRVNVFIGANGSGKSNLLEAIGMLGAAAFGRVDAPAFSLYGIRLGFSNLFTSSFKRKKQPSSIHLSASNEKATFSVDLTDSVKESELSWSFKNELLQEDDKTLVNRSQKSALDLDITSGYTALSAVELKSNSLARLLLQDLRRFAIYSPNTITLRGVVPDAQSRDPIGLGGGRLAEAVDEIFRFGKFHQEIHEAVLELIDWASDIGWTETIDTPIAEPNRVLLFKDRYMAHKRNVLSGFDVSEGALYVLFMAVLIHHPRSSAVVAVDNFDQALNPRLARALTSRVCEWVKQYDNKQIFLTSHNASVLDGLPLLDDSIRLFTVSRSSLGTTLVQRVLVNDDIIQRAKNGIPLSQQWIMGVFGGVPSI